MRDYYVYIMTNDSGTLYVGMTNDLERRVHEHRQGLDPSFTSRYKMTRLVYFEPCPDAGSAIAREKQLEGWVRRRKIALIASVNPYWRDLGRTFDPEGETLRFAQGDGGGQRDRAAQGEGSR